MSQVFFRFLADAVVFFHFLWILFLIFGFAFGRKSKKIKLFHIGGLFFAIFIQAFDFYCPLTYLEVFLRQKHDPQGVYAGSFIIYYLEKLIYMEVSRVVIVIVTFLVFGVNMFLYFWPIGREKKKV